MKQVFIHATKFGHNRLRRQIVKAMITRPEIRLVTAGKRGCWFTLPDDMYISKKRLCTKDEGIGKLLKPDLI